MEGMGDEPLLKVQSVDVVAGRSVGCTSYIGLHPGPRARDTIPSRFCFIAWEGVSRRWKSRHCSYLCRAGEAKGRGSREGESQGASEVSQ